MTILPLLQAAADVTAASPRGLMAVGAGLGAGLAVIGAGKRLGDMLAHRRFIGIKERQEIRGHGFMLRKKSGNAQ